MSELVTQKPYKIKDVNGTYLGMSLTSGLYTLTTGNTEAGAATFYLEAAKMGYTDEKIHCNQPYHMYFVGGAANRHVTLMQNQKNYSEYTTAEENESRIFGINLGVSKHTFAAEFYFIPITLSANDAIEAKEDSDNDVVITSTTKVHIQAVNYLRKLNGTMVVISGASQVEDDALKSTFTLERA